jgi:SAM-dependent methyltransferase
MKSTNYEKFQTRNPVVRRLIDRFYMQLSEVVRPLGPDSVLDAGCGEGETLARLATLLPERVVAVDLNADAVDFTVERFPAIEVAQHSIEELPFGDASFDLVLCLEVLEHLPDPGAALAELARVARNRVVISVPHEPWFRFGSLVRGKYLGALGNHPEHVNHWNPHGLRTFLQAELEVVSLKRSFPWLIADCRPAWDRPKNQSSPRSAPAAG